MYGEAVVVLSARIKRENAHVVCSINCISVTDDIKINEQNKLIGIGPLDLCLQIEFEAISLLLSKVMVGLNPVGCRTMQC